MDNFKIKSGMCKLTIRRVWRSQRDNQNPYIEDGLAPGFVTYKKGCTRLAAASDKVYQLLAHGRWFSPGTPASYITKIGRHNIAEILLKVALNTKNQPYIEGKKNRQHNGQKKKYKRTINDLQNIHIKLKIE